MQLLLSQQQNACRTLEEPTHENLSCGGHVSTAQKTLYPTNRIAGATKASGVNSLALYPIYDDAIVDREDVRQILLDEAPIKRPPPKRGQDGK
jgi:hypothetical protein